MLETVVPKTGGVVMIVGGKDDLRGLRGSLLQVLFKSPTNIK
jgi:hypothetical protein